jgi:hypothetical protein
MVCWARSRVLAWQTVTVASFLQQHQRHGFAHDVAGPDDDGVLPGYVDAGGFQQQLHAVRCAGRKDGVAGGQCAHVVEVKAVHVFVHVDGFQHAAHVG